MSLIVVAFWIRLYQNISEVKVTFKSNDLTEDQKYDKIFDNVFEVLINLVLISILPAVAVWTAYQRDPNLTIQI